MWLYSHSSKIVQTVVSGGPKAGTHDGSRHKGHLNKINQKMGLILKKYCNLGARGCDPLLISSTVIFYYSQ